jgi:hypothetical protein
VDFRHAVEKSELQSLLLHSWGLTAAAASAGPASAPPQAAGPTSNVQPLGADRAAAAAAPADPKPAAAPVRTPSTTWPPKPGHSSAGAGAIPVGTSAPAPAPVPTQVPGAVVPPRVPNSAPVAAGIARGPSKGNPWAAAPAAPAVPAATPGTLPGTVPAPASGNPPYPTVFQRVAPSAVATGPAPDTGSGAIASSVTTLSKPMLPGELGC